MKCVALVLELRPDTLASDLAELAATIARHVAMHGEKANAIGETTCGARFDFDVSELAEASLGALAGPPSEHPSRVDPRQL